MNIFNALLKSDTKIMGSITDHPITKKKKKTNHSTIWGVNSECIKFFTVKSKPQYKWPFCLTTYSKPNPSGIQIYNHW